MYIYNSSSVYILNFTYTFYLLIENTKMKRQANNRLEDRERNRQNVYVKQFDYKATLLKLNFSFL